MPLLEWREPVNIADGQKMWLAIAPDQVSWAITLFERFSTFVITVRDPRNGISVKFPEGWKNLDDAKQFAQMGENRRVDGRFTVRDLWERTH